MSDDRDFCCPNGHVQRYTNSIADTLKQSNAKVEELKRELDAARTELRQVKCDLLKFRTERKSKIWGFLK